MIRRVIPAVVMTVIMFTAPPAGGSGSPPTCDGRMATHVGTPGPDVLIGTPSADVIVGLDGDDRILGGGGDDHICGNGGHDVIIGQGGADRLFGGPGADRINGRRGGDTIDGGPGDDRLVGSGGGDRILGFGGNDDIRGGPGDDHLAGGAGDDRLQGGDGNDHLDGGVGNDRADGGSGLDTLVDTPGRYAHPRVGVGSDGWLYLADEFTMPCANEIPHDQIAATMAAITTVIADSGRTGFVMLAPGKDAIHQQHLGTLNGDALCAAERRSELRAAISAADVIGWIDMWGVLRHRAQTEDVYLPLDSHWTTLGGLLATKQVVDALSPGLFSWDEARVRDGRAGGDLAGMAGLAAKLPVVVYTLDRGGVAEQTDVEGHLGPNTYRATAPGGVIDASVLVVHDSFGNRIEPMLNQFVRDSTFVSWTVFSGMADRLDILADLVAAHDVVVFEHSERGAYQRFGAAYADLPGALASAFATAGRGQES